MRKRIFLKVVLYLLFAQITLFLACTGGPEPPRLPICKSDRDCGGQSRCIKGSCKMGPVDSACTPKCKSDEVCKNQKCEKKAEGCDPPCGRDETCNADKCEKKPPSCHPKCEKGQKCKENNCVDCINDSDCAQSSDGRKCNNKNKCVTCLSNADCGSDEECKNEKCAKTTNPGCHPPCSTGETCENQKCVGCQPACQGGQKCKNKKCVDCTSDDDCVRSGKGKRCKSDNTCVACFTNSDCLSGEACNNAKCIKKALCDHPCRQNGKVCKESENRCVDCVNDNDCVQSGKGKKCKSDNTCVTCLSNTDCPSGQKCKGDNTCAECSSHGDCDTDPYAVRVCNSKGTCERKCPDLTDKTCGTPICKALRDYTKVTKFLSTPSGKGTPECKGVLGKDLRQAFMLTRIEKSKGNALHKWQCIENVAKQAKKLYKQNGLCPAKHEESKDAITCVCYADHGKCPDINNGTCGNTMCKAVKSYPIAYNFVNSPTGQKAKVCQTIKGKNFKSAHILIAFERAAGSANIGNCLGRAQHFAPLYGQHGLCPEKHEQSYDAVACACYYHFGVK